MPRVFEGSTQTNPVGTALQPIEYLRLLRSHVHWWAVPAVVFALIAGFYSLVAPRQWKATQALVIRPEVASVSEERLGKFNDLSEMKTSQETILELWELFAVDVQCGHCLAQERIEFPLRRVVCRRGQKKCDKPKAISPRP